MSQLHFETRILVVPVSVLIDDDGSALVDTPWTLLSEDGVPYTVGPADLQTYFLPFPLRYATEAARDIRKLGQGLIVALYKHAEEPNGNDSGRPSSGTTSSGKTTRSD